MYAILVLYFTMSRSWPCRDGQLHVMLVSVDDTADHDDGGDSDHVGGFRQIYVERSAFRSLMQAAMPPEDMQSAMAEQGHRRRRYGSALVAKADACQRSLSDSQSVKYAMMKQKLNYLVLAYHKSLQPFLSTILTKWRMTST